MSDLTSLCEMNEVEPRFENLKRKLIGDQRVWANLASPSGVLTQDNEPDYQAVMTQIYPFVLEQRSPNTSAVPANRSCSPTNSVQYVARHRQ